jgi:hypothetical protein
MCVVAVGDVMRVRLVGCLVARVCAPCGWAVRLGCVCDGCVATGVAWFGWYVGVGLVFVCVRMAGLRLHAPARRQSVWARCRGEGAA